MEFQFQTTGTGGHPSTEITSKAPKDNSQKWKQTCLTREETYQIWQYQHIPNSCDYDNTNTLWFFLT